LNDSRLTNSSRIFLLLCLINDGVGDDTGDNGFIGKVLPAKSGDSLSKEIFELCKQKQLVLEELHVEPGRLDDVFREITVADTSLSE